MKSKMRASVYPVLLVVGALGLASCQRAFPIYEANGHMFPTSASTQSLDQIGSQIIKAARSQGWLVDRTGPMALQATTKWGVGDKHVVVVRIEYNQKSYSILHVRSQNLLEGIAPSQTAFSGQKVIHKRRNARVRILESAIERELYGTAS